MYWNVFALSTLCSARVQALHAAHKTQRPLPHAAQHTQNKNGVTRMLTLPVQHVPALNPHSKLPSDKRRIARSTWFDFQGFCVRVLPCPAGGLVHTDAQRKSREIHQRLRTKASPCMGLANHTAWFEKLPRQYVQFLSFFGERDGLYGPVLIHNQVSWEEVTKTNPGSKCRM